jgi:hypothetical protein
MNIVERNIGNIHSLHGEGIVFCDRRWKIPLLIVFHVALNISAGDGFIHTSRLHSVVKLGQTNIVTTCMT